MEETRGVAEAHEAEELRRRLEAPLSAERGELSRRNDERDEVDRPEAALHEEAGEVAVVGGEQIHGRSRAAACGRFIP